MTTPRMYESFEVFFIQKIYTQLQEYVNIVKVM